MKTKEPETTAGYIADLEKWGCKLIDQGERWAVQSSAGGITSLESTTEEDAAFEAWHLMKP